MKRALILASILLSGCGPYWVRTADPVQVSGIARLDNINVTCTGNPAIERLGCFSPRTRAIFIKKGLAPALDACVEAHERKHAAGYDHHRRGTFVIDCGNGETHK